MTCIPYFQIDRDNLFYTILPLFESLHYIPYYRDYFPPEAMHVSAHVSCYMHLNSLGITTIVQYALCHCWSLEFAGWWAFNVRKNSSVFLKLGWLISLTNYDCENVCCSTWKIVVRSGHNFAHGTAAELLCHLQNCDLVGWFKIKIITK